VPVVDDLDQADRDFAAAALEAFPGNMITSDPITVSARIARSLAASPAVVPDGARWLRRFIARSGGLSSAWRDIRPMTFVMHQFIDAADTAAAWEHIELGTRADDERILEAQERLESCAYIMGHPDRGESVPACVQHSVLDPAENRELARLLPLPTRRS